MKERTELKQVVEQYLAILENQGLLMWDRLNSGSVLVAAGPKKYRVQLCRPGTADYYVLRDGQLYFMETKSTKKDPSNDQRSFSWQAWAHGAEYHVIRSLEDLQRALGMCPLCNTRILHESHACY